MSNYAEIKINDIANGSGIGVSIFFSGCSHCCPGCFNSIAWDYDYGESYSEEVYLTKIKPYINEHISHISILGGEPLDPQNTLAVLSLLKDFKKDFPDKKVWLWTGYYLDENNNYFDNNFLEEPDSWYEIIVDILHLCDIVVDGPFIQELKDLKLKWRGSSNQRVIDIKKSFSNKKLTLYAAI